MRKQRLFGWVFVASLILMLPWAAAAQDQPDQDDQPDPPSRVARLNYIQGSVSFQPAGQQDWVDANPNRPLTTGDNLWVDQNSRGELHIGSTVFRLSSQTGISFLNLNDEQIQIQLAQGTLNVHVRRLDDDEAYEIDTPNLAFSILRTGDYRLDVDPDGGSTTITVFSGQGEVTGGNRTYAITPGQRAVFTGTDELNVDIQRAHGFDEFDNWGRSREDREEHSESARYVSRDVTGYDDLDAYGRWQPVPEYGQIWIPNGVAADWAPYHYGHWAFIAPWGWTWVDDAPWGFAPFHYGRWAFVGGYWGWIPGPIAVVRPVYAPALVGFVGGGGFGVAVGFGAGVGVAWFPLGPRDVFIPAYHVSARYAEVINVSNSRVIERTTVVNVYRNYTVNHVTNINYTYQTNTRAVTAVSRETFVNARPVARATIQVSAQEVERPRVVQNERLAPVRASVVGPSPAARVRPPAALANRQVVTKMAPARTAVPMGRPRPAVAPNAARQTNNANEARPGRPPQPEAARPNENAPNRGDARPGGDNPNANPRPDNRPFTPPNRENPNASPNARPVPPAERENPNANPHPDNRPAPIARPENPPNENPPRDNAQPKPQPNRPFTPPNRESPNPQPERPNNAAPPTRPQPQAQPDKPAPPPRTDQRPQPPRPPQQEAKPQPAPEDRQKARQEQQQKNKKDKDEKKEHDDKPPHP
jgi:hypothetical protein